MTYTQDRGAARLTTALALAICATNRANAEPEPTPPEPVEATAPTNPTKPDTLPAVASTAAPISAYEACMLERRRIGERARTEIDLKVRTKMLVSMPQCSRDRGGVPSTPLGPPPPEEPAASPRGSIIALDLASSALIAGSLLFFDRSRPTTFLLVGAGVAAYAVGAPAIHASANDGRALRSAVLRVGLPPAAALIGYAHGASTYKCGGDCDNNPAPIYALVAAPLGMLTAMVVDWITSNRPNVAVTATFDTSASGVALMGAF